MTSTSIILRMFTGGFIVDRFTYDAALKVLIALDECVDRAIHEVESLDLEHE